MRRRHDGDTTIADRAGLGAYLTERWLPLQESRLRPRTYRSYKSVVDPHIVPGIGYTIGADHGPSGRLDHWAIARIPGEVTELFSKRSSAIDAAMEAEGFASYRARGIAARATRDGKEAETHGELIARWHSELEAIGGPGRRPRRWPPRPQSRRWRNASPSGPMPPLCVCRRSTGRWPPGRLVYAGG